MDHQIPHYQGMTKPELIEQMAKVGLTILPGMKKADLVRALIFDAPYVR
jgi:hypothetical protein